MRAVLLSAYVVILVAIARKGPAHAQEDSTQLTSVVAAVNQSADIIASLSDSAKETHGFLQTVAQSLASINIMMQAMLNQYMTNCDPVCINGQCVAPRKCKCDDGWVGDHCQCAVCEHECINGKCTAPNSCTCDPGWNGNTCQFRCPKEDNFFMVPGSNQCFAQFYRQQWTSAMQFCKAGGMELAEPDNAVELQKYLNEKGGYGKEFYGHNEYWVGGLADGSTFRWLRGCEVLDPGSPLWYPGEPFDDFSTGQCLILTVTNQAMTEAPGKPYVAWNCSSENRYGARTLCELIME